MSNTIWIVTKEVNDYNQYGEYFVAAFKSKPTKEKLSQIPNVFISEDNIKGMLSEKELPESFECQGDERFILEEVPAL